MLVKERVMELWAVAMAASVVDAHVALQGSVFGYVPSQSVQETRAQAITFSGL